MAGRGPAPQEHRQRPRDEKAQPWDTLPAAGYDGEFPALPASWQREVTVWERDEETREKFPVVKLEDVSYLPGTREWYETFARSPMAARFVATDWVRLREIAPLKDQYLRGPSPKLASELRLQETRLGATVRDRQEMRMRVEAAPAERPAATVSNMASARKDRLRAVPKAS